MEDGELLSTLKVMLEEMDEETRVLDDARLLQLLNEAEGDLRRAAYRGAILKAKCTGLHLPDGVTVESNREYWLTVARSYRPSFTTLARRSN